MQLLVKLIEAEFRKLLVSNSRQHFLKHLEQIYLCAKIYKYVLSDEFIEEEHNMAILISPAPLRPIYDWFVKNGDLSLRDDISSLLYKYETYKETLL